MLLCIIKNTGWGLNSFSSTSAQTEALGLCCLSKHTQQQQLTTMLRELGKGEGEGREAEDLPPSLCLIFLSCHNTGRGALVCM